VSGIEALNIASPENQLEMIASAEPDLIITLSEADYDNFAKIAPTVLIPYGTYSSEELFYYLADLVGQKSAAEAYMKTFLDDANAVKTEMQDIVGDRTVSFIEVWPNEIYVMGSHFARGGNILFELWGLKAPAQVQASQIDGDTQYEVVSLEVLPTYAGDFIFYSVLADADSAFVENSAVWKNLPAVQDGQVKEYEQVAFMHSDPITLKGQLEFYTEYFRSLKG
jgi:iron complex transport system substrate-binding protein